METSLPPSFISTLDTLSIAQLRQLNQLVVEKLKLIRKAKNLQELSKFNVLDRVFFDHHGERIMGTITRLNQKTATIRTDDGGHWNVAPCFLRRFQETSATSPEVKIVQESHLRREPYPGASRNQACPCGSNKKYKKCCLVSA